MLHEQLIFEMASDWSFKPTERTNENVTMRDYFVQLMVSRYSIDDIAEMIGKHRTSVYSSIKRFNVYYKMEKEYRQKFNEIQHRFLAIEIAEEIIWVKIIVKKDYGMAAAVVIALTI